MMWRCTLGWPCLAACIGSTSRPSGKEHQAKTARDFGSQPSMFQSHSLCCPILPQVVLAAVSNCGSAIQHATPHLQRVRVSESQRFSYDVSVDKILSFAPLWQDIEIAATAMLEDQRALTFIPQDVAFRGHVMCVGFLTLEVKNMGFSIFHKLRRWRHFLRNLKKIWPLWHLQDLWVECFEEGQRMSSRQMRSCSTLETGAVFNSTVAPRPSNSMSGMLKLDGLLNLNTSHNTPSKKALCPRAHRFLSMLGAWFMQCSYYDYGWLRLLRTFFVSLTSAKASLIRYLPCCFGHQLRVRLLLFWSELRTWPSAYKIRGECHVA